MRQNPVSGDWVIIATERNKRPKDFNLPVEQRNSADCVFCSGNEKKTPPEVLGWRQNDGAPDTPGWSVRGFPNKFPAVAPEITDTNFANNSIWTGDGRTAFGYHEVFVDSPDHSISLGRMSDCQAEIALVGLWKRYKDLFGNKGVRYIQVFKNWGSAAGASLEHTHWQIITLPVIPPVIKKEMAGADKYFSARGRCVFCRMAEKELMYGDRTIVASEGYIAIAPFASRFPFETWILPTDHEADFRKTSEIKVRTAARILRNVVGRLEKKFDNIPYNIVLHSSPLGEGQGIYHWHIEILPRLTAVAGFEWGTGVFINPTRPETAAAILRQDGSE